MNTSVRILICVLVAILAICVTAAIQVYSGGPYSNALALLVGVAAFIVAWLSTRRGRDDAPPWWWWWW